MTNFATAIRIISLNVMLRRSFGIVFLLALLMSGARARSVTDGSTPLGLAPGSPAGSYALSGIEDVNLYNGHLNLHLPLLQVGGRGTAQYMMTLLPINASWIVQHEELGTGNSFNYPSYEWWAGLRPGYGPGVLQGRSATSPQCVDGEYSATSTLTRLTFTAPDGTEFELRDQAYGGQPHYSVCYDSAHPGTFNRGRVFITADGTTATFISDTDIYDYLMCDSF